jgi:hypothetical protein
VVDVGADRAGALRAHQEVVERAPEVDPVAQADLVQVVAGAHEGLGHAQVGRAFGDEQSEVLEESGAGVVLSAESGGLLGESGRPVQHDGFEQRLLRREVPAHGARAHPGAARDLLHRHRQSLRGECREGDLQDAFPVAARVGAHRPQRVRHSHLPTI